MIQKIPDKVIIHGSTLLSLLILGTLAYYNIWLFLFSLVGFLAFMAFLIASQL